MNDLAQRVAELQPTPWGHLQRVDGDGWSWECVKCGKIARKCAQNTICKYPDPVDITDLGKALEYLRLVRRDKTDEGKLIFIRAARQVSGLKNWEDIKAWLIDDAIAEEIFEICVIAKEGESK